MTDPRAEGSPLPDRWTKNGYPPVQFITYAQHDPDSSVLDVSYSLRETRRYMEGRSGYVYRVERLPETTWKNPQRPEYGNETFVQVIP